MFALLYGMSFRAIVSILPQAVDAMAPDMKNLGTRMGTAFAIASIALLVGNPIEGALLKKRKLCWTAGIQRCLLDCELLVVWVRAEKVGWKIRIRV